MSRSEPALISPEERRLLGLMEGALTVSEYTDNVDTFRQYGKEERMSDLLSDSKWGADSNLKLRQHDPTSFYVQGTKAYQPTDSAQMNIFVQAGVDKRTVAETNMNHQSSRSHSILTISIRQHMKSGTLREGKIRLVDLAGSENLDRSGAQGQQANEAIAINASLSVLRSARGLARLLAQGALTCREHELLVDRLLVEETQRHSVRPPVSIPRPLR